MIATILSGGLGNQMFQYAAARRLAEHHRTTVAVDTRMYDAGTDRRPAGLEAFGRTVRLFELDVTATVATADDLAARIDRYGQLTVAHQAARVVRRLTGGRLFGRPATHVRERQFRFDPAVLALPDGVYLQGLWQSWRYFADAADTIRRAFRPRDPAVAAAARSFVEGVRDRDGRPVVAVHVRRGDLAHAAEQLRDPSLVYGPPVGVDYIRAAAARFGDGVTLLVFSDTPADLAWCRQHLPAAGLPAGQLRYADGGGSDVHDLFAMSYCDGGHVIANSTFSWWAAWLAGTGRVVAPRRWGGPASGMTTDDLIPSGWEQI